MHSTATIASSRNPEGKGDLLTLDQQEKIINNLDNERGLSRHATLSCLKAHPCVILSREENYAGIEKAMAMALDADNHLFCRYVLNCPGPVGRLD
jgi:hypothetical protein